MSLKLFYWDDVDALEDFATGHAFALAESKEQAIELVVDEDGRASEPLRLELTEKEPRVIDEPEGFTVSGGS